MIDGINTQISASIKSESETLGFPLQFDWSIFDGPESINIIVRRDDEYGLRNLLTFDLLNQIFYYTYKNSEGIQYFTQPLLSVNISPSITYSKVILDSEELINLEYFAVSVETRSSRYTVEESKTFTFIDCKVEYYKSLTSALGKYLRTLIITV